MKGKAVILLKSHGKTVALIGALVVISGPAFAATSQPSFDAFVRICADTHVDYASVAKLADAGGWKPLDVKADTMDGVAVSDRVSRQNTAGKSDLTLFAWQGKSKSGAHVSACTVRVSHPDFAGLQAAAQAWTGFAPQTAGQKRVSFRFTDTGDVHNPVTPQDTNAAAAGAGVEIMTVWIDPDGGVLDLLKIKK